MQADSERQKTKYHQVKDTQTAKNLKRNLQYIPVQDREAALDIGGAPSAGMNIINIFLNIFSLKMLCHRPLRPHHRAP